MTNTDPLLHDPTQTLHSDSIPYGEVVAENRRIMDQLTETDINHGPMSDLLAEYELLQVKNPGAFKHLSAAAISESLIQQ